MFIIINIISSIIVTIMFIMSAQDACVAVLALADSCQRAAFVVLIDTYNTCINQHILYMIRALCTMSRIMPYMIVLLY